MKSMKAQLIIPEGYKRVKDKDERVQKDDYIFDPDNFRWVSPDEWSAKVSDCWFVIRKVETE